MIWDIADEASHEAHPSSSLDRKGPAASEHARLKYLSKYGCLPYTDRYLLTFTSILMRVDLTLP